jgi:hypothetical protein
MKERMLYKTLVVGVIVLFIGVGIQPAIALDNSISNESINKDGLVDKISISIWGPAYGLGFFVFGVTLEESTPKNLNVELYVNVTREDGTNIIKYHDKLIQMHGPFGGSSSIIFRYIFFLIRGFLIGDFDINVDIRVLNDGSSKSKTAHGKIFFYFFIPWAIIKEE